MEIEPIKSIDVQAGDLLVVMLSGGSIDAAKKIEQIFADKLPEGVKVAVVNAGLVEFLVIRKDQP